MLCCPLSVLTEVNTDVICMSSRVAQFEHFDAEMFVFFRDVLLENYPSVEFHNDFLLSLLPKLGHQIVHVRIAGITRHSPYFPR